MENDDHSKITFWFYLFFFASEVTRKIIPIVIIVFRGYFNSRTLSKANMYNNLLDLL